MKHLLRHYTLRSNRSYDTRDAETYEVIRHISTWYHDKAQSAVLYNSPNSTAADHALIVGTAGLLKSDFLCILDDLTRQFTVTGDATDELSALVRGLVADGYRELPPRAPTRLVRPLPPAALGLGITSMPGGFNGRRTPSVAASLKPTGTAENQGAVVRALFARRPGPPVKDTDAWQSMLTAAYLSSTSKK